MKNRRYLSIFILLLVFVMSGVAIYIGMNLQTQKQTTPGQISASTPTNCTALTQDNPTGDKNQTCGQCEKFPIPYYCAWGTPFKATKTGKVVLFFEQNGDLANNVYVNGTKVESGVLTDIEATTGTNISVTAVFLNGENDFGWTNSAGGYICGEDPWGKDDTIAPRLANQATAAGYQIMEVMCWADMASDSSTFDFNDYPIVVAVEVQAPTSTPTTVPTETPTEIPTSTPTDAPTATPTTTNNPTSTPTATPTGTLAPTNTRTPTNTPRPTIPVKITKLPPTAIIDDKTDTIIFGVLFMLFGIGLSSYIKNIKQNT
jgi:hypothetical protein